MILKAQGDLAGALEYTRRALAIDETVYGPDHPNVAIRASNIGTDPAGPRRSGGRAWNTPGARSASSRQPTAPKTRKRESSPETSLVIEKALKAKQVQRLIRRATIPSMADFRFRLNPRAPELPHCSAVLNGRGTRYEVDGYRTTLSLKSVVRGAARYHTPQGHYLLTPDSFLILNDGQRYSLEFEGGGRVQTETLCPFFQRGFLEQAGRRRSGRYRSSHACARFLRAALSQDRFRGARARRSPRRTARPAPIHALARRPHVRTGPIAGRDSAARCAPKPNRFQVCGPRRAWNSIAASIADATSC
jgi:hypothetical protein